ncbi:hypothetical protein CNMCM5793_006096 [Aspergillus hiratsukae]|uniref:Uncharacterized protein n=1 Tax=Aspergillus hiratsukae TaxID=1194566 RepID=A0A8H6P4A6_9EURO|nr:hypothetical protein CNMCM5793_006096 [Aspergillus hiratsukae]KAF7158879.1 hypothetical protein CNMCM6106_005837 [Aspergillus hiratsukae]
MEDDLVPYLKEESRQHSRPDDRLALIPRGLPSMCILHDGAFYYSVNVLKESYAETRGVKHIEEASLFRSVG